MAEVWGNHLKRVKVVSECIIPPYKYNAIVSVRHQIELDSVNYPAKAVINLLSAESVSLQFIEHGVTGAHKPQ
jgi:hypothetical protein